MTNLSSVTSDQMELLFMLLKLQNADKRACDLFPSYRTEKFCQLGLVRRSDGSLYMSYGSTIVLCYDLTDLYCFSAGPNCVELDIGDLLKHISFEDKI